MVSVGNQIVEYLLPLISSFESWLYDLGTWNPERIYALIVTIQAILETHIGRLDLEAMLECIFSSMTRHAKYMLLHHLKKSFLLHGEGNQKCILCIESPDNHSLFYFDSCSSHFTSHLYYFSTDHPHKPSRLFPPLASSPLNLQLPSYGTKRCNSASHSPFLFSYPHLFPCVTARGRSLPGILAQIHAKYFSLKTP